MEKKSGLNGLHRLMPHGYVRKKPAKVQMEWECNRGNGIGDSPASADIARCVYGGRTHNGRIGLRNGAPSPSDLSMLELKGVILLACDVGG